MVGITCFRSGIIGHVGMDFLALRENGNLRLWAVDLNLHLTATQASFKVFHFVCRGASRPLRVSVSLSARAGGGGAVSARRALQWLYAGRARSNSRVAPRVAAQA